VGDRFITTIEKVAHGGHFIARHLGAVIFVSHAIPGEEVEIEITGTGSSFNRADVVKVLKPSPDRVVRLANSHTAQAVVDATSNIFHLSDNAN
jgi:tRNA/tmRNA/rRNA uracil-C5-methylase (TrmA/RlmC/RlmD family)